MPVTTTRPLERANPSLPLELLIKAKAGTSSEQGLTLVEALLAILVVTILLSFITPLVFIATATRIQNRRAEQAMELAQGEIDRVQVLMAQGVTVANEDKLPPVPTTAPPLGQVDGVGAPTAVNANPAATEARAVDVNGDGDDDFLIQTFRDKGARFDQGAVQGELAVFSMGVRVYANVASDNLGNLQTEIASLQFATGSKQQSTRPLASIYNEISRSDAKLSMILYDQYLECKANNGYAVADAICKTTQ